MNGLYIFKHCNFQTKGDLRFDLYSKSYFISTKHSLKGHQSKVKQSHLSHGGSDWLLIVTWKMLKSGWQLFCKSCSLLHFPWLFRGKVMCLEGILRENIPWSSPERENCAQESWWDDMKWESNLLKSHFSCCSFLWRQKRMGAIQGKPQEDKVCNFDVWRYARAEMYSEVFIKVEGFNFQIRRAHFFIPSILSARLSVHICVRVCTCSFLRVVTHEAEPASFLLTVSKQVEEAHLF